MYRAYSKQDPWHGKCAHTHSSRAACRCSPHHTPSPSVTPSSPACMPVCTHDLLLHVVHHERDSQGISEGSTSVSIPICHIYLPPHISSLTPIDHTPYIYIDRHTPYIQRHICSAISVAPQTSSAFHERYARSSQSTPFARKGKAHLVCAGATATHAYAYV